MSAIINIFDSAFSDEHRKIKVEAGLKLEEVDSLDWDNTLIYVNGFERNKDYRVRDKDVVTIRQFPSNDQGSPAANAWMIAGWLFMPVTSFINYVSTGSTEGAILAGGRYIDSKIKEAIGQPQSSGSAVGQTEQIPTISGAKNRSGAGQPIPLLIGESMYTPITIAQSYTTVSGRDGEEQTFHALYCLGYKDIDLKSVSLGIYKLSNNEKNGVSGELSCDNLEPHVENVDIPMLIDIPFSVQNPHIVHATLPVSFYDKPILNINRINNYQLGAKSYDIPYGDKCIGAQGYPAQVDSCAPSANGIEITVPPQTEPYTWVHGTINFNASVQWESTAHYPKEDAGTRKGYHQHLELQQNGARVSLYPQKVVQENNGTELMHPEEAQALILQPFSAKYPEMIELEVTFQNLVHFNDKGEQENAEVELCVGYSLDGGNTYLPFNAFEETGAIEVTDEGTYQDSLGSYRVTKFKGKKNKAMRFIARKQFDFGEVFNIDDDNPRVKNNVIEFRIWRKTVDVSTTDSKYQYKCFFSAIRTWCYDYKETKKAYEQGSIGLVPQEPISEKYRLMTARLGFEIRAGEELNGTIDELNVEMMSRARWCEGGEWSGQGEENPYDPIYTRPTNNPASLALMILQHPMRGEYAYTDDQIDLESFAQFYEWCEQTDVELRNSDGRKYTANGVISRQFKTIDLVNQILGCGHGKLIIKGNKYGVIYDRPDIQPVMILNNQNVLSAKNTKNFDEEIDGYSCTFIDSLNGYQEDTLVFVPKDLQKSPDEYKLENLELPFITDAKRAYRMAMYQLACRKLRPETWERKLGVDGNLVDVGSLVCVQDDTISVGIGDGAQITKVNTENGYIVSVEVDYGFNVSNKNKDYGIKIQHASNTNGVNIRTYQLARFGSTGKKKVLTFAEPILASSSIVPAVNDIVSFGLYEKITTDALCVSKKSNNDGTFTLTLVPYQDNIYMSEYGEIPQFVSNVTEPTEAGQPVDTSSRSRSPSFEYVESIGQGILNTIEIGTNDPPTAPSDFTINAYSDRLELNCVQTGYELKDTVKYYEFEITRKDSSVFTFKCGSNTTNYYFNRSVDNYPEASDLSDWSFRVRAINIYNKNSAWINGTLITTNYGTWTPANPSFVSKIPSENNITFKWNVANGAGGKQLYGNVKYELKIYYDSTLRQTITTNELEYIYSFNRDVDEYPEQTHDATHKGLDLYTFDLKIFNEAKNASITGQYFSSAEIGLYKTWIIPQVTINSEIVDRTAILTAVYNGDVYGRVKTLVRIKRDGNTYPVDTDPEYTYNDLLGITADSDYYTPEFRASVQPKENYDREGNYRTSGTTAYESASNKITHTLPLIGQTPRIFKAGEVPVQVQGASVYTKDVDDVTTVPTPSEGLVIHYIGDDVTGFTKGGYYLYENSAWVQVYSRSLMVPTSYTYEISMTNESGSISTADPETVEALPTNIADIVHSHEHYKDIYVEKLSAISANIGLISQGGMGDFQNLLNMWALSDLSAEDSGVVGGIKKGTFRVGGRDQYFMVTPDPNDPENFSIELRAGSINLTTDTDKNGFINGTYIYEGAPETSTMRLALTSQGIIAQKKNGNNWVNVSKFLGDKYGNLIMTNKEDVMPYGQKVNGSIYHFDSVATQDENGTNSQSITCDGDIVTTEETDPILEVTNSPRCFRGDVEKSVSGYTGNIVAFSKSDKLLCSGVLVTPSGIVDNAGALNTLMTQSKGSGTVGSYLGLSASQISSGIFKNY